jgi:hypothetical protein
MSVYLMRVDIDDICSILDEIEFIAELNSVLGRG